MRLKIKDPFLQRFEDRCEKLGEGGIFNLRLKLRALKNDNKKNIEENLMDSNKKQNSILSRMKNKYNALTFQDYKNIPMINLKKNSNENEKNYNKFEENTLLNHNMNFLDNINNDNENDTDNSKSIINKSEMTNRLIRIKLGKSKINNNVYSNSFPKNSRYNSIFNNNGKSFNKNKSLRERFYKPYSLKEYKSMMDNYKKDKFGGLGINMNQDWTKRQKIYNKVKNFENSLAQNFNKRMNELNARKKESPQKAELMRKKMNIINSKRFMAQKYGKGVMLNKIREQKRKEIEEFKFFLKLKEYKENVINKHKKNILNKNDTSINNDIKEDFKMKLLKLKSALI